MDDILIYLRNENSHLQHVEQVISVLEKTSKGISHEKLIFFKKILEFLGFVFSIKVIKTCPSKVSDILNFKGPTTLRGLRSF